MERTVLPGPPFTTTLGGLLNTGNTVGALLIAIGLALLGAWLLKAVQRAKETGIARFPLGLRSGFNRAEQPIRFNAAVVRNTLFGITFCAMAGAIVVVALASLLI